MSEGKFDGLLLNVAQQHQGIEDVLDTFFSFLARKTDFFTRPEQARDTVMRSLEKNASISEKIFKEKEKQAAEKRERELKKKRAQEEQDRKDREEREKLAQEPKIVELPSDDEEEEPVKKKAEEKPKEAAKPEKEESTDKSKGDGDDEEDEDDESKGQKPNAGNGGTAPWGYWTQTLQELQMYIKLDGAYKGKQISCDVTASSVTAGVKGKDTIVKGSLLHKVREDDSFWTLEDDGTTLAIHLTKVNQMEWWKCAVEGDPAVNLQKVQPENSKLTDLDGETRKTVEKMMYDQKQKALGLPTSEQEEKNKILQNFMKQHPEMDFSNAKIC